MTASTPHLVKIGDNRFVLMWSSRTFGEYEEYIKVNSGNIYAVPLDSQPTGEVFYVELDGEGNMTSDIMTYVGYLSDCAPIFKDDKIIWYVTEFGETTFDVIDLNQSEEIKLSKTTLTLEKGKSQTIKATVISNNLEKQSVTWSSSNNDIVTVSAGKVTAVGVGSAKVTATTANGKTAVCTVTVCKKLTKLNLNANRIVIGVGEGFKLNSWVNEGEASYKRSFSSYTSNVVAYVSGTGYIVGKRPGSDIITVKGYNGVKAECVVIVKKAPDKLNLNKYQLTLKQGQYFHLNSWITEGTASYKRAFSSSNNSICYTNGRGDLKGIKKGTAVITVKTYNGVKAQCKVTVV